MYALPDFKFKSRGHTPYFTYRSPKKHGTILRFAWIGGFSAATQLVRRLAVGGQASKLRLLWIRCGTGDPLLELNRKFPHELRGNGYIVKAVETSGAGIWPVWQRDLASFVQLLFR